MEIKEIEKYRAILKKHGHNVSDEELFEIANNIGELADVIIAFEKKKKQK